MINVLILGGTGYIGSTLTKYMSSDSIHVFPKGTTFYKTEKIKDVFTVQQFIINNNITHLIDLTRSNIQSLVGFYSLIKCIPKNIVYIHLSSYSIIDPNVYKGCKFDITELKVSQKIDIYLDKYHSKYYSLITPQIVNDVNNFTVSDLSTVRTTYTYVCNEITFSNFVINKLKTNVYGIYEVPAIKKTFR